MMTDLQKHIAAYQQCLADWLGTAGPGENLDTASPEYEAYCDAEFALVTHPCRDLAEVKEKVRFCLECQDFREDLDGSNYLVEFLQSLIREPVDCVESGDN